MAQGKAQRLGWCPACREHSLIRRCYMRKTDNRQERLEFCVNKGCGYKLLLPFRILAESEVNNVSSLR
jgi:hypothetical protein